MPDSIPLVSVTICCYNSERYLANTLQSLLDQTFTDFEVILLNDGSTDSTEQIVRSFTDPRIRYEHQPNRGLVCSRNRTIELARGKYIAFLDHDDLWHPNKLAAQITLMEARNDIGLVYSKVAIIDKNGNIISESLENVRVRDGNVFSELLLQGDFIVWSTVVIRHSILKQAGQFRPYKIAEDYDMLLRCALIGNFAGLDQVLAQYRQHDTNYSRNRITPDTKYLNRRLIEELLELIEIEQDWLVHLPEQHQALTPAIQGRIADLFYYVGRAHCLGGSAKAGASYLRKAWPRSRLRWLAIVAYYLPSGLREYYFRVLMQVRTVMRVLGIRK